MNAFFFLIVALFIACTPTRSYSNHILFVYRNDIEAYKKIVKLFKQNKKISLLECPIDNSCSVDDNNFDFIVALGDSAAKYSHRFKKPLIAFFISDYSLTYSCPSQKCLYYFLFPNAKQILSKLSNILPAKSRIAILCSNNSISWINQPLKGFPFEITVETISSSEILNNLRKIFRKNYQVILLAPDLLFLQKKVLREIIKLSYTSKKLVIGFSPQMLDLGLPMVITYDYKKIYSIIPKVVENFKKENYISFPISILINKKAINFFHIKEFINEKNKIK